MGSNKLLSISFNLIYTDLLAQPGPPGDGHIDSIG